MKGSNNQVVSSKKESHLQRRLSIVNAAAAVFLEAGFDKASMQEIARRADVSKQTVYSHFGSKEALFKEAIIAACRAHTPEGLENISNMSLEDTLRHVGKSLAELIFSEEAIRLESLCISGNNSHPEAANMYWQAGHQWVKDLLVNCLQAQIDNGNLEHDNVELAAQQFISLLLVDKKCKLLLGIESVEDNDINLIVDQAVSFFLKASR